MRSFLHSFNIQITYPIFSRRSNAILVRYLRKVLKDIFYWLNTYPDLSHVARVNKKFNKLSKGSIILFLTDFRSPTLQIYRSPKCYSGFNYKNRIVPYWRGDSNYHLHSRDIFFNWQVIATICQSTQNPRSNKRRTSPNLRTHHLSRIFTTQNP